MLVACAALFLFGRGIGRTLQTLAISASIVAGLAGPAAYSLNTAATPHTGSIVTAGPARATGLDDRGEIALGKRGDLVRVALHGDHPVVREVYRLGRRVA